MRKTARVFFALLALMMTLAACSKGNDRAQADRIYKFYKDTQSFSCVVKATLDHGEYVSSYTLEHSFTVSEGHIILVVEPASLAGLQTKITPDRTEVIFEGNVFIPPDISGTNVTPIRLLPDVFSAWCNGIPELAYTEKRDGQELIVLTFYTEVNGDEFMHKSRFDMQTLLPVDSESYFGGKLVFSVIFESSEIIQTQQNAQT